MPVTISPALESIVSVANAKVESKILTDENFEVLSVQPFRESTSTHNTLVTVKIDLGVSHPLIAIPESDRFTKRTVKLTRINLADVAKFRNIPVNEKGQYIIDAGDVTELATALGANFDDTDVEIVDVSEDDGLAIFRAKPDSLGWIGRIGVAESVTPPPDATAVTIVQPTTIETIDGDATVQLTFTTTPTEANTDGVAIWSITSVSPFATINESTGELIIIDASDESTITVRLETINGVFTTKTFTTNNSIAQQA